MIFPIGTVIHNCQAWAWAWASAGNRKGSFLLEVLVAVSLMSVSLVVILNGMMMSYRVQFENEEYVQGVMLMKEELDQAWLARPETVEKVVDGFRIERKSISPAAPDQPERLELRVSWTRNRRSHDICSTLFL